MWALPMMHTRPQHTDPRPGPSPSPPPHIRHGNPHLPGHHTWDTPQAQTSQTSNMGTPASDIWW